MHTNNKYCRITFATPDRSGFEFARVAVTLAMAYPEAETIHLVLDNLNIHRRKALADAFGAEMAAEVWDRFTVHYTPTHGSWLNQAEIEIGIFSRQCLGHRCIPDLKTLRREAKAWNRRMNRIVSGLPGSSTAKPLAGSLAINPNVLNSHRPSPRRRFYRQPPCERSSRP
jgi:hypothetical protein